jgi:serine/threonine-protein kinase
MAELFANRYELIERVGVGGMAEVFKARMVGPVGFQKLVALKRILQDLTSDQDFLHRFIDEARLTARLQHPNVCQVLDFGEDSGRYYITMEYIEGLDLSKTLMALDRRGDLLPPDLCLAITAGVLRGLGHAHGATDEQGRRLGLVHRDVSPQNVLLSINGDIKLGDFGVAKANAMVRRARTMENIALGKLAYMAPEQRRGEAVDERTDVYGTGILLAEMLQGPTVFRRSAGVLGADRDRLISAADGRFPGDLVRRVGAIIERAVEQRPDRRYAEAFSMLADVEACARELGLGSVADRMGNLVRDLRDDGISTSRQMQAPAQPPPEPSIQEISASQLISATGPLDASPPPAQPDAEELRTQVKRGVNMEELATQVHRGAAKPARAFENLETKVHSGRATPIEELKTQVRRGNAPISPSVGPTPPAMHSDGVGSSDLLRPAATESLPSQQKPDREQHIPSPSPAPPAAWPSPAEASEQDAAFVTARNEAPLQFQEHDENTDRVRVQPGRTRQGNPMFWGILVASGVIVIIVAILIGWRFGTRTSMEPQVVTDDLIGATPATAGRDQPPEARANVENPAISDEPQAPGDEPPPTKTHSGQRDLAAAKARPTPSPRPPPPLTKHTQPPRPEPPAPREPSRPPSDRSKAMISIFADPPGQAYVDGRLVGTRTPVQNVEVSPGRHEVRVRFSSNNQEARRVITVRAGDRLPVRLTPR